MKATQPDSITKFIKSNELTFEIPVYQRNYVWNIKDCEKLFDDILAGIKNNRRHYFGNIVYYEADKDPFTGYTRYVLIDGQQRITSTMLLLAAIRDEEEDNSKKTSLTTTYLTNEKAVENFRVKLKQVETDRDIYEALIEGRTESINKSSIIYRNYNKFRNLVKNAKKEYGMNSADILKGIEFLDIIAIDLESSKEGSESPQVIFESINATGKPLSTADLLRNFLLLEVGIDKQEYYYKNFWLTIEKNIGNDNISDYIRRYLTLKRTEDIKRDTEYKEFKDTYKEDFTNAEEAITELTHYSKYYKWVKSPESVVREYPDTSAILQDLDDLRMLPATPSIMWLLEKADTGEINFDDVNETLDVIGAWSFRARITNIINTGEIGNILTTKILELLKNKKSDDSYADYIWFELSNYRIRDIYPSDAIFKEAFAKYDFYKSYRTYVQIKLETPAKQRAGVNDKFDIELESIEHIMPQTIKSEKWPGITTSEHAEWINTIGNLTPMNMIDNPAASNGSIEEKRPYIEKSAWQLTKEVDTKNGWGIATIQSRGNRLAEDASKVWRAPKERTREIEASQTKTMRTQKFVDWMEEYDLPYIKVDRAKSTIIYFESDFMNQLIPRRDTNDGSWGNGQAYCYYLQTDSSGWTRVNLSFTSPNKSDEQTAGQKIVMDMLKKYPSNDPWVWFNPIGWTLNYEESDDVLRDDLERILTDEILRFEQEVAEFIKNQD